MAKLPEETVKRIYEAGYVHGKADAYREIIDIINFLAKVACDTLEKEIRELTEKNH